MIREKSFYKQFFRIAIPVAFQMLLYVGVNMLDNIMVGSLGEIKLSGVAMANQITVFLSFFIKGVSGGSSLIISQYWGKSDYLRIKTVFAIVLRFAFWVTLSIVIVIFIFPSTVMRVLTNDENIIREGASFLRIVCFSYIFATLSDTMAAMLRSIEIVRLTLIVTIFSLFFNLSLNYMLIFGKFGMPALGIKGAALATVITRVIEFIIVLYYVLKIENKIKITIRDFLLRDKLLFKDFIKYGLPVVGGDMQWGLVGMARSMVIGRLGTQMVSANSITEAVMSLAFAFTTGLSNAACVVIGKSIGSKDLEQTKEYSKTIQIIFAFFGISLAGLLFLTRGIPISLYKVSAETKALAMKLLAIGAASLAPAAYHASCFVGINRGAGDTKFVFLVDMVCGWLVVVPATILSGLVFSAPLPVVYFFSRFDQFFKSILAFFRLKGDKWINNVTRDGSILEINTVSSKKVVKK